METTDKIQKGTGLFCEGCKHEFLPGELMLMAYEDSDTEIQTSFCCDCLAYELAVETAVPEDFIVASRTANNGVNADQNPPREKAVV